MLTGASPSRSARSLFDWKNKRGGEESAYGTAADIAVSLDHPRRAAKAQRFGQSHFPTVTPCSIDRALPGGGLTVTCLPVPQATPTRFCAVRRTGLGCAMFPRFPSPVPVWADARPAPERFARLRRLSLNLAFVGPARHRRGRRFPTASGFGRFPPFAGERKTLTNP